MFETMRGSTVTRAYAWGLGLLMLGVSSLAPTIAGAAQKRISKNKAYTFAGIVVDRSRKVKKNQTTAEVKVVDNMPTGKNTGKSYDIVFVIRPGSISDGKVLTLTSGPVAGCRSFVKKFLTKTLSPKRIKKAYKGAKLATIDKDSTAKSLAENLEKGGWLSDCAAKPKGKLDVFQVLIVNDSDM